MASLVAERSRPLLLLPPIPPSIRVFSNESTPRRRWPKYWSFSFSIIPSKEIPGLISFRMDWLDPDGSDSKECRRPWFGSWFRKMPCRRKQLPTPVFLPGKPHRWRSLAGYSPWGHKELDTTERFHFLFTLEREISLIKQVNTFSVCICLSMYTDTPLQRDTHTHRPPQRYIPYHTQKHTHT